MGKGWIGLVKSGYLSNIFILTKEYFLGMVSNMSHFIITLKYVRSKICRGTFSRVYFYMYSQQTNSILLIKCIIFGMQILSKVVDFSGED